MSGGDVRNVSPGDIQMVRLLASRLCVCVCVNLSYLSQCNISVSGSKSHRTMSSILHDSKASHRYSLSARENRA